MYIAIRLRDGRFVEINTFVICGFAALANIGQILIDTHVHVFFSLFCVFRSILDTVKHGFHRVGYENVWYSSMATAMWFKEMWPNDDENICR